MTNKQVTILLASFCLSAFSVAGFALSVGLSSCDKGDAPKRLGATEPAVPLHEVAYVPGNDPTSLVLLDGDGRQLGTFANTDAGLNLARLELDRIRRRGSAVAFDAGGAK